MAANKVFVSPGVYTSERDLTFVSQNIGVTTLGIVGETLKGPAFEKIFITNYDEYRIYFGGTSPEKFVNTQIPKYEASYIAKSYLEQSNQLFVTRILGLSGYDAGPSWSILLQANVDSSTVSIQKDWEQVPNVTAGTCDTSCTAITQEFTFSFSGCDNGINSIVFTSSLPAEIQQKLEDTYRLYNGSVSDLETDIKTQLLSIFNNTAISGDSIYYYGSIIDEDYDDLSTAYTEDVNVFSVPSVKLSDNDLNSANNDPWYYSLFDNYSGDAYSGFSFFTRISGLTEVILPQQYVTVNKSVNPLSFTGSGQTLEYTITVNNNGNVPVTATTVDLLFSGSPFVVELGAGDVTSFTVNYIVDVTDVSNKVIENTVFATWVDNFGNTGTTNPYSVSTPLYNPCNPITIPNVGDETTPEIINCYSGTVVGKIYYYSGTAYTDYNNLVVATLRSRGLTTYDATNSGPKYEVTDLNGVTLDTSGSYADALSNPFSPFAIKVTNSGNKNFAFKTSLNSSEATYISKVFGEGNFSKKRTEVPLFLEEKFNSLLRYGYNKGYIKGIKSELLALPGARQANDSSSIGYYLDQYQTPESPWVVSELRGSKVYRLFKAISIADGNSANKQVKISILNISFNKQTFDVVVRDYYDTDSSIVVLEKFTNCSMDPSLPSYIGKKIGTSDGKYQVVSKYIMIEVNDDAPTDAVACGFEGYMFREYSDKKSPFPVYKTKYDYSGEEIFNPPFGTPSGGSNSIRSSGDNVRRTYLGISSNYGFDADFFEYFGKRFTPPLCDTSPSDWSYITKGFHMDSGATAVTIADEFTTSGLTCFEVGSAEFRSEPTSESNPYYRTYARKFTFLVQGGFDGWDIYTESRTNTDRFRIGADGYLKGACADAQYDDATGLGLFKRITIGDNSVDYANTDYYAYLLAQKTYENPEAVDINILVTPGIDISNNVGLVQSAIDMIEVDRADSIYIPTMPDFNLFIPNANDMTNMIYPQEAVEILDTSGIDSSYTTTYYPWVLKNDSENTTKIYIPPTADVVRNLALTDNISFPWFATAGFQRGVVNAEKTRIKLTQEHRNILYDGRINSIATFRGVGPVIFGNKTLQIAESALDRLNVRRLLLQARKLISAVGVRLLFEQNDQKVRQDFIDAVNPILDGIRRDRGLYDFRVVVQSTPEDLERQQLVGKIYLKPTKALEFIDIEFLITPTGASFEDI